MHCAGLICVQPGADPGAHRPHLRHRRLHPAVSRPRPAARHGTIGRHTGGSQLRPWRQRLVAELGFEHDGRRQGDPGAPARDRRDRLRRARSHLGNPGAARRRTRHDLCGRALAADPLGPGVRRLDAGLAHRARLRRQPRLCRAVGGDGTHRLQDAPRLSRPARRAGGMDRLLLGGRRHRPRARYRSRAWTSLPMDDASPIWCPRACDCRRMPRRSGPPRSIRTSS